MLGTLLLIASAQASPAQSESSTQVISKMLARYAYAESLSGNITYSVSDGAGTASVKTDVKYVRPNLLSIKQDRTGANGLKQAAISDGALFMYDLPMKRGIVPPQPNQRMYEPVNFVDDQASIGGSDHGFRRTVGELYNIAHVSLSPSTALDIAIGFKPHLADLTIHLGTFDKLQSATYKGKSVFKITGDWRVNRSTEMANGKYELLISHEYDFLRLVHNAKYNIGTILPGTNKVDPGNIVTVTTTEVADLKVNAEVDSKAFNYRKKKAYDPVRGWH